MPNLSSSGLTAVLPHPSRSAPIGEADMGWLMMAPPCFALIGMHRNCATWVFCDG